VPADEILTLVLPATDESLWATLTAAGRSMTGAVRLVIVRGQGADFFDGSAAWAPSRLADISGALGWLRRPDVITLAAIRGRATGAGLDVAMACDLRVVADDAELVPSTAMTAATTAGGLGIGVDTIVGLGQALGYPRALEFLIAGGRLSGTQAAALGLANLAVEAGKLDAAVDDLVASVLSTPRATVTMAKAALSAADVGRPAVDDLMSGLRLAADEA
jgi:enoyl-CoA hydratase/carnithine racemase